MTNLRDQSSLLRDLYRLRRVFAELKIPKKRVSRKSGPKTFGSVSATSLYMHFHHNLERQIQDVQKGIGLKAAIYELGYVRGISALASETEKNLESA